MKHNFWLKTKKRPLFSTRQKFHYKKIRFFYTLYKKPNSISLKESLFLSLSPTLPSLAILTPIMYSFTQSTFSIKIGLTSSPITKVLAVFITWTFLPGLAETIATVLAKPRPRVRLFVRVNNAAIYIYILYYLYYINIYGWKINNFDEIIDQRSQKSCQYS